MSVARQAGNAMVAVSKIFRYPIKGLSAQPLSSVVLEADRPFPYDRIFALARPGAPIDRNDPKWAKKGLFVMLMLDENLARVDTCLDLNSLRLTVRQGNQQVAAAQLSDEEDRTKIENFFWQLLPTLPAPPALVRSASGHFMDKPDNVISLINLATVRTLEAQWGVEIDPLRFRANIYVDGAKPWEEFDWIGSEIRIGSAVFAVDRKNGRCGATNVNPTTGRRDLDIPSSLRAAFGHKNLGVYLIVRDGGQISVGDSVLTPHARACAPVAYPLTATNGAEPRFICRGCYFVYEEANGLPQQSIRPGTAFADIPANWRCPDCGTEKTTFRPYVEKAATGSNSFFGGAERNAEDKTSALQQGDQARCIPAAAAAFLHALVELIDERGHRQRVIAPRFGEAGRQILAHPIHREAEIELAVEHGLIAVLELPALRCALRDHLGGFACSRPACTAKFSPSEVLNQPGNEDLIDHLGELAIADRAHMRHRAAVMRHHRLGAREAPASPPTITVSLPLSRRPGRLTPAHRGSRDLPFAAASSSRANSAEAVV